MMVKRALSRVQGFFGELYLCGAEVLSCKRSTAETPHRHACRCSKLWSSDPVCHRCSCVPCAASRAEWAERIKLAKQKAIHESDRGLRPVRKRVRDLREKDRADLALLRARIKVARIERIQMMRGARASCRTARAELVERQRGDRQSFVERQRAERIADRTACSTGKAKAKTGGVELEKQSRSELAAARKLIREVNRADHRNASRRSTSRERSQEDDDAVRGNLPPELRPVFDKVRRGIKATGKKSRTEAFLDWAEENPEEILIVQQAAADRELKAMLKAQREHGRTVRDARRYKLPPDELAKLLEAVPF